MHIKAGAMLKVENIETYYGSIQALFGMDLEINEGEMVALLGRNGMGKTTTIRSIMGLTPAVSGTISFCNRAIRDLPPYRVAQLGIGLVPEGRQVFSNLTVRENLLVTATVGENGNSRWSLPGIYDLFPLLAERRASYGATLSGGEQQMLAIGRALMTNPKLLVLDEATEGLAPRIRSQIWQCLEMLKNNGQAILVIDKNVEAVSRICDRAYIIRKGRAVWHGPAARLRTERSLRERYLGL